MGMGSTNSVVSKHGKRTVYDVLSVLLMLSVVLLIAGTTGIYVVG